MSKLPGLTYGTWDALRAGHLRRDAHATPAAAPDPVQALEDLIREADSLTIAHGSVPGVSDRWSATARARVALAYLRKKGAEA